MSDRWQHRADVTKDALQARVPGKGGKVTTLDLAKELIAMAREGLGEQAAAGGHPSEAIYLAPLSDLLERGMCPADEALAKWQPRMSDKELIAALLEPA